MENIAETLLAKIAELEEKIAERDELANTRVRELEEKLGAVTMTTTAGFGDQASGVGDLATAIAAAMEQTKSSASLPGPPTFTGEKDSLEWSAFLELFEDNLALNGWDQLPSSQKTRLLQSSMRMQAANVFHSLSDAQKKDYDLAKSALTRIFVNPAKVSLYQNEFEERMQRKGESLQDLAMNLKKIVKKAYPEIREPRAYDALANRRFVEAIFNENLRNSVRIWRRDTLEGTLVEAIRLEGALQKERTSSGSKQRTVPNVNSLNTNNDGERPEAQRETRTCYYCKKVGHIKKDCRKLKSDLAKRQVKE